MIGAPRTLAWGQNAPRSKSFEGHWRPIVAVADKGQFCNDCLEADQGSLFGESQI